MKNICVIILVLVFSLNANSQKFEKTSTYNVTKKIHKHDSKNADIEINLVRSGNDKANLFSFMINDTELFEEIFVTSLKNPGLTGIKEVVKIEVEYLGCCAHVASYYVLIHDNQKITKLPQLNNVYCKSSDTDHQYTFPNQNFGVAHKILQTQTFYTTFI